MPITFYAAAGMLSMVFAAGVLVGFIARGF